MFIDRHAIVLAIGACAFLILVGILTVVMVTRLNHVPAWWSQLDTIIVNDSTVVEQAEHLENAITTQLTAVRDPADPRWTAAINPDQANAWLEARLIETITTHLGDDAWPSEVQRIRIGIKDDRLIIGVRVTHASGSTIVWATVRLELDADGELWAMMSSVHAGTAPVPIWVLGAMGNENLSQSQFRIGSGQLELGDGRTAQLIALRVSGGRLEVVMETR